MIPTTCTSIAFVFSTQSSSSSHPNKVATKIANKIELNKTYWNKTLSLAFLFFLNK